MNIVKAVEDESDDDPTVPGHRDQAIVTVALGLGL